MKLSLAQAETLAMLCIQDRSALSMFVLLRTLESLRMRGLVVRFGTFHEAFPLVAPWRITSLGRVTIKAHDRELTQ